MCHRESYTLKSRCLNLNLQKKKKTVVTLRSKWIKITQIIQMRQATKSESQLPLIIFAIYKTIFLGTLYRVSIDKSVHRNISFEIYSKINSTEKQ